MNVRQIEYILAVAKFKSFGKAAVDCNITQSTLSTMIGKYEDEIGIKIFDRSTKPIILTEEGSQIVLQMKMIQNEINSLEQITQELKGEISGNISMGVIPTIAPYLFPHILEGFVKKYKSIQFEVSEIPTEKIITDILSRDLDIAIASTPINHKDILEIPLYTEKFLIYDQGKTKKSKYYKITELDVSRLWLLEEGHCMRNQVMTLCDLRQQENINGNLIYKSGTIETLLKLVEANNGLTLLPFLAALELTRSQNKHVFEFSNPIPARNVGILVHKHYVKKKLLAELQKTIQKSILPILGKTRNLNILNPL